MRKAALGKALAILLALLAWQAGAMLVGEALLLASPLQVAARLWALIWQAGFWRTVLFSFARIVAGFLLALLAGGLLAAAAGRFRWLETLLWPWVVTVKSVPVASFIILCLAWLTARQLPVFISFLMVFPIIYTNLLQGIRSADPQLLEMARLFRVPWGRRLRYIWPGQLRPFLLSACSVSLGLAWKAGVTAEIIGIPDGSIGERLYEAKIYWDSPDLLAWTVVIVAISVCFEKLFVRLLGLALGRRT